MASGRAWTFSHFCLCVLSLSTHRVLSCPLHLVENIARKTPSFVFVKSHMVHCGRELREQSGGMERGWVWNWKCCTRLNPFPRLLEQRHHSLRGSQQQNVTVSQLWSQKSKIQVSAGPCSLKPIENTLSSPLPASAVAGYGWQPSFVATTLPSLHHCQMAFYCWVFTWLSFYRDTSHSGLGSHHNEDDLILTN